MPLPKVILTHFRPSRFRILLGDENDTPTAIFVGYIIHATITAFPIVCRALTDPFIL